MFAHVRRSENKDGNKLFKAEHQCLVLMQRQYISKEFHFEKEMVTLKKRCILFRLYINHEQIHNRYRNSETLFAMETRALFCQPLQASRTISPSNFKPAVGKPLLRRSFLRQNAPHLQPVISVKNERKDGFIPSPFPLYQHTIFSVITSKPIASDMKHRLISCVV